jgi:hypothetical protein
MSYMIRSWNTKRRREIVEPKQDAVSQHVAESNIVSLVLVIYSVAALSPSPSTSTACIGR